VQAGAAWADTRGSGRGGGNRVHLAARPAEVETVALGERGLLQGLGGRPGVLRPHDNAPAVVRRIHGVFAARGIHMLDAPVSGRPRGAETRKLALWVGGDANIFGRYKPVLDAIGDQAYYVGRSARARSRSWSITVPAM